MDFILEKFGKQLIQKCFDIPFYMLEFYRNPNIKVHEKNKEYIEHFKSMDEVQIEKYIRFHEEIMTATIFEFMKIFEENKEFELNYRKENGELVNLSTLSDHIMAEPLTENGWIKKFSKYRSKKNVDL